MNDPLLGWREVLIDPTRDLVLLYPPFVHEIGDRFHHMSMVRTCDRDEEGDLVPGTGPHEWRFKLHEFLDSWVFYPVRDLLEKKYSDGDKYRRFRTILGFFWGLNCGFPLQDVVRYTLWDWRGCRAARLTMRQYRRLTRDKAF